MFRTGLCILLFFWLALPVSAQKPAAPLSITESEGKFGLKEEGKWKLKPRYDQIIEISTSCFVLRKKTEYFLYHNAIEYRKGKYRDNSSLQKGFTALITPRGDRFALANEKGLFAYYVNGIRSSDFLYTDIKFLKYYELSLDVNRQWNLTYAGFTQSKTLKADSLILRGDEAILLCEKTNNGSFGSMAVIGDDGSFRYPVRYDQGLGMRDIVAIYYNDIAIAKAVITKNLEISPWYKEMTSLENGNYIVETDTGFGLMDQQFKTVIPNKYNWLAQDGDHYLAHQYHDKRGFLGFKTGTETVYFLFNEYGKYLVESYSSISRFTPNSYRVGDRIFNCDKENFEEGVFNILDVHDSIYLVYKDSSFYYVNRRGERSTEFPVALITRYERERGGILMGIFKVATLLPAAVDIASGKDPFGKTYAKVEKEYGHEFFSHLACVPMANDKGQVKYGYIDTNFRVVIPPMYDDAGYFSGDIAFVGNEDGKRAIINRENKKLSGYIYDSYDYYTKEMTVVEIFGGPGYFIVDQKGQRLKQFPYFDSYEFVYPGEGYAYHKKDTDLIIKIYKGAADPIRYKITRTGEMIRLKNE